MSLPLPGERRLPVAEAAVAIAAVTVLCSLGGCATPVWTRTVHPAVIKPARIEARSTRAVAFAQAARDKGAPVDGVRLVEGALGAAGLRLGTDGRPQTLWMYLSTRHTTVPSGEARPGDIVLFDSRPGPRRRCADHAGVIERVEPDGRIQFIEARDGRIRTSYLHPFYARARRDGRGEILNSFLQSRRVGDPEGTPYLAGDMMCAVVRLGTPRD